MKNAIPPTKLHIAHVSLGTNMGGMEKLLVEFARHTDRSRIELHFICLQERGRLANDIEDAGWSVTALDKSPGFKPMLIWKLSRLFRKLNIDVVHTHNTAAYLYGIPAAKLARIRRTIHTRHGQRYDAPERETNRFRRLSFLVDQIVSVSNDSRELTIAEGIDPAKAVMIWNGIDIEKFPYSGPNLDGPAILVARLSPEKILEPLNRALVVASRGLHA